MRAFAASCLKRAENQRPALLGHVFPLLLPGSGRSEKRGSSNPPSRRAIASSISSAEISASPSDSPGFQWRSGSIGLATGSSYVMGTSRRRRSTSEAHTRCTRPSMTYQRARRLAQESNVLVGRARARPGGFLGRWQGLPRGRGYWTDEMRNVGSHEDALEESYISRAHSYATRSATC